MSAPASPDTAAALRGERLGLRWSAGAAAALGVLGVVWGVAIQSQALLLDGVYALIGMVLALVTLHAARLAAAGPTERYPFGREALGPLMVAVQGLVLLGTLAYAALDAVLTIRAGGSDAAVGSALLYAALSLVVSLALLAVLRRVAADSELVAAEAAQWRAGCVLSALMAAGFALAVVLSSRDAEAAARFVDPALVLLAAALLVPTPVRLLRSALGELVEAAPPPEIADPVHEAVREVVERFGLPAPTVRVGKLGRKLYLEVDVLVEAGRWAVGDADQVRHELVERLAEPGRALWVNVELHTDPDWDR
jgi:cation diffusion facilitator family transporter